MYPGRSDRLHSGMCRCLLGRSIQGLTRGQLLSSANPLITPQLAILCYEHLIYHLTCCAGPCPGSSQPARRTLFSCRVVSAIWLMCLCIEGKAAVHCSAHWSSDSWAGTPPCTVVQGAGRLLRAALPPVAWAILSGCAVVLQSGQRSAACLSLEARPLLTSRALRKWQLLPWTRVPVLSCFDSV